MLGGSTSDERMDESELVSWRDIGVQLLSHVQLFVTLWAEAHQAFLSFTISWSFLKLMSIESVMPSNHLILSPPSPSALSLSQHQGLYQWVSSLHQVIKYWNFSFFFSPSSEHSGLISFRIDWFDLLAIQGNLRQARILGCGDLRRFWSWETQLGLWEKQQIAALHYNAKVRTVRTREGMVSKV